MLFVVNGLVAGTWLSRLVDLQLGAGLDVGGLAVALIIKQVGSLGGGPLAALVIGRRGSRVAASWAAAGNAGALLLLPFLPGLSLGVGLAVLSLTDSVADLGMNVQGAAWEAGGRRSIMQRLHGGWSLGLLVGTGVGAIAAGAEVALGIHFAVAAGLCITAALTALPRLTRKDRIEGVAERGATRTRTWSRAALLLGVLGGSTAIVEVIPTEWIAVSMTQDLSATAGRAGAALTVLAAAMLVGRAIGDRLTDAFGVLGAWRLACVIALVGVTTIALSDTTGVRIVGVGVLALGMAQLFPAVYRAGATTEGISPGAGLAAMATGAKLGLIAANLAMALATTRTSIGTAIWLLVAPAAVLVLVLAGRQQAPRRTATAAP